MGRGREQFYFKAHSKDFPPPPKVKNKILKKKKKKSEFISQVPSNLLTKAFFSPRILKAFFPLPQTTAPVELTSSSG